MNRFLIIVIFTIFTVKILCQTAFAANQIIEVTGGNIEAIPTAINDFSGTDSADLRFSNKIVKVIQNDLRNSGIFKPISKAAFIEKKIGTKHTPLFAAWQQINASLLINGHVERTRFGKIKVNFILWDSYIEQKMTSKSFELQEKNWRQIAHKISDDIYKKITGYKGYFNTQIVYISESGDYLNRVKRIAIMDQDGANHRYLTDGSDLVLTPRFSPDGKKILYLSYKNNTPKVYVMDIKSLKTNLIGNFPGMSFAPHFSSDANYVLMSIAKDGKTHIYELNLKNKKIKQLTQGVSINTSPSYSPNNKQIVFNSDRYGARQLFIMNRDGSDVKRISYSGGSYSDPSWSKNNYITFIKTSRHHGFTVGVMRPNASPENNTERLISNGYLVESPTWSTNGRVIIFTKGARPRGNINRGLHRIYSIDFTGHNERLIPTPHDASDADWSAPKS